MKKLTWLSQQTFWSVEFVAQYSMQIKTLQTEFLH